MRRANGFVDAKRGWPFDVLEVFCQTMGAHRGGGGG